MKEINDKHNERIPDPFNENNLKMKGISDATGSLQINVVSAKNSLGNDLRKEVGTIDRTFQTNIIFNSCLLYTSDAADE